MAEEKVLRVKKEKKQRKEKKDKKEKKEKKVAVVEVEETKAAVEDEDKSKKESDSASPSKKRKRGALPDGELEIDITLPEPPSKKALRKLKKAGIDPASLVAKPATPTTNPGIGATQVRSKHGVWIGNMSFNTTEAQLREFLLAPITASASTLKHADPTPIAPEELEITRINFPTKPSIHPITKRSEMRNRGFAYVDFKSQKAVDWIVENKSEKLLVGRKVLIKDSHDYTGRPAPADPATTAPTTITKTITTADGQVITKTIPIAGAKPAVNPPSKILFLGNLPFDTTDEEIAAHFAFAGTIVKTRIGRFEDSGKCKGFGFLDFEETEDVTRAMKGISAEDGDRLYFKGRKLRMEYGEDAEVRYKKRWGGKKEEREGDEAAGAERRPRAPRSEGPRFERKVDARTIPPGEALARAMASRMTGAIVEAKGKKVVFD
ncbi:hypothetical protein DFH27DRAFT_508130 [Peziza echinospora]|nr:hypothetical protein DFH27DRAFT_508130 [Peziza echinospora]